MIYVGAFPGLWLFMFSCGDMQGHPKQNYLMLYYSTALLQTWGEKKAFFFRWAWISNLFIFCVCHFVLVHSHIHTPQKEQSAFSQVPFFSQNLIFIYSVIHPLSTSFYQGGKEANPGQFVRLSQDQCRQGKHAKTWVIIETGTVVFWGDVLTAPQVPSFQYNLLCIIGLNVV